MDRSPRVLVLEPSGLLWGSERVLLDTLAELHRFGWRAAVCCPPRAPIVERIRALEVPVYPVVPVRLHIRKGIWRIFLLLGLVWAIWRWRPDVLYLNQAGPIRLANLIGRVFRVPIICHLRLVEDARRIAQICTRPSAVHAVVCISHFIRQLLPEDGLMTRVEILYDSFTRRGAERVAFPTDVAALEGPLFVCVGRFSQSKGQDVALDALAVLHRSRLPARLAFVGGGAAGDNIERVLRRRAEVLGITDLVQWFGFVADPYPYLRKAEAVLCPSRFEPLGRVILEAWDAGVVPIVWAGSGGAAEIVNASGGGIQYGEQTGESLAGAMQKVIGMPERERLAYVRQGREWMSHACDSREHARRLTALFHEVAFPESASTEYQPGTRSMA